VDLITLRLEVFTHRVSRGSAVSRNVFRRERSGLAGTETQEMLHDVDHWRVSRETGLLSREPGAGSREPGAGSREPGAGSREPGAGSREPGAGSPFHVKHELASADATAQLTVRGREG
jgi:hypothetical protein